MSEPTLEVDYGVEPSGSLYRSESDPGSPLFIGILVPFHIVIRVPGVKDRYALAFAVRPPPHFTVRQSALDGVLGLDGKDHQTRIYDTMASVAFDRLGSRLKAAFFRLPARNSPAVDGARPSTPVRVGQPRVLPAHLRGPSRARPRTAGHQPAGKR